MPAPDHPVGIHVRTRSLPATTTAVPDVSSHLVPTPVTQTAWARRSAQRAMTWIDHIGQQPRRARKNRKTRHRPLQPTSHREPPNGPRASPTHTQSNLNLSPPPDSLPVACTFHATAISTRPHPPSGTSQPVTLMLLLGKRRLDAAPLAQHDGGYSRQRTGGRRVRTRKTPTNTLVNPPCS